MKGYYKVENGKILAGDILQLVIRKRFTVERDSNFIDRKVSYCRIKGITAKYTVHRKIGTHPRRKINGAQNYNSQQPNSTAVA